MDNRIILRPDGTPDWGATLIELRAHPPQIDTPQSLAADIARLNYAERERVNKIVAEGGWAAVQREHDLAANADRRAAEERGRVAQKAEAERTARRLEELRLQQEAAVEASSVDPETGERCTATELVLRNHARAMAAIAARAAEPVHMTDAELQAAYQRKTELTARYNSARDESLRPKVDLGKF